MKVFTAIVQMIVLMSAAVIGHPAARLGTPPPALAQSAITTVRSEPIAVGDTAPDFTLEDQNKHKVTLSEASAQSPVVLVFYRGYW